MRPTSTHINLAVLAIALGFLGTVSYIGSRDAGNQATASPVTAQTQPLLAPAHDVPEVDRSSRLVHPLVGVDRATLEAELGPPSDSYTSGTYSFLTYRTQMNRYQVVLQADTVVEVSQIN